MTSSVRLQTELEFPSTFHWLTVYGIREQLRTRDTGTS
jgi:hypothetical protein